MILKKKIKMNRQKAGTQGKRPDEPFTLLLFPIHGSGTQHGIEHDYFDGLYRYREGGIRQRTGPTGQSVQSRNTPVETLHHHYLKSRYACRNHHQALRLRSDHYQ